MKKIILAAFMAACGLQMSAQQNLFVAQDLESAIVNKDNTVTFQVESGDRMEFEVDGSDYGLLVQGDIGKLSFQGTRYLGFERS